MPTTPVKRKISELTAETNLTGLYTVGVNDAGSSVKVSLEFLKDLSTGTWLDGSGVPSNSIGSDGNKYLRTSNGQIYKKVSGVWQEILNITGPQGPKGDDGQSYELLSKTAYNIPVLGKEYKTLIAELGSNLVELNLNEAVTSGTPAIQVGAEYVVKNLKNTAINFSTVTPWVDANQGSGMSNIGFVYQVPPFTTCLFKVTNATTRACSKITLSVDVPYPGLTYVERAAVYAGRFYIYENKLLLCLQDAPAIASNIAVLPPTFLPDYFRIIADLTQNSGTVEIEITAMGNDDVIIHNHFSNLRISALFDADNRPIRDFYSVPINETSFILKNDFSNDKYTGKLSCVKY